MKITLRSGPYKTNAWLVSILGRIMAAQIYRSGKNLYWDPKVKRSSLSRMHIPKQRTKALKRMVIVMQHHKQEVNPVHNPQMSSHSPVALGQLAALQEDPSCAL
jgi:hypothetical protein